MILVIISAIFVCDDFNNDVGNNRDDNFGNNFDHVFGNNVDNSPGDICL